MIKIEDGMSTQDLINRNPGQAERWGQQPQLGKKLKKATKYYLELRMDARLPIVVLNELPGCWKQCRQVRLGHWSLD